MNRFASWLIRRTNQRPADFIIGDGYLYRWWLIPRNPIFNVYLHAICRDDDDRALHDHPWMNLSIILCGVYRDVMPWGSAVRRAGDWCLRLAKTPHRLEVVEGPVWTLFITGPRVRAWGFWCPQGWRHWREFTAADDPGQVGRGCGE